MSVARLLEIGNVAAAALGAPPWPAPAKLPKHALPRECDVLVVGAGITGLAAAMWLARSGRDVAVIDRRFGSGASSRNGGIVLGDTLVGPSPAFVDCHLALRKWVADEDADCEMFWCGCLELARDPLLPALPVDWQAEGPLRMVGEVTGGVLNPVKLQNKLAEAARKAGAAIVDETSLVSLAGQSRPDVQTDRGEITAGHVVMAVDATARTHGFDPWNERVITVALQTAPLSEGSLATIGLLPHQAFYSRDLPLFWGRAMPDRSLLIGRETIDLRATTAGPLPDRFAAAAARLASRVRALHPELKDIEVCRSWGGPIARNASGVPSIAVDPEHPRVLWAGGYGGHGVAQAFRMGRLVAERLSE